MFDTNLNERRRRKIYYKKQRKKKKKIKATFLRRKLWKIEKDNIPTNNTNFKNTSQLNASYAQLRITTTDN
jgi:hypothetical protein